MFSEALLLRNLAAVGDADHIFLIGAGGGHLVSAVARACLPTKVLVLEPDPQTAARAMTRRDWQAWLETGRLRMLTGPDYVGASSIARHVNGAKPSAIVVNDALAAQRPDAAARAVLVARRIQHEAAANAEARRRFAGRYLLQTLGNLAAIEREGNVSALDGAFAGRPAVIVAAGPSLDRNLPALVGYQERAVVIAADTTLRPLLAGAVRPHLVLGVDPNDVNARHLAGVPDTSGIWLAAEGSLHPSVFGGFAGRTFVFKVSHHEPWPWLDGAGFGRGTLRAWGSVVTSALDLALRMGCNPIVFVGHDFAYTDGRPYCDNTVFHEEWRAYLAHNPGTIEHYEALMKQGRPIVSVTDLAGMRVETTAHLVAFRDWVVEQTTLARDRTFINATDAGILQGPHIVQTPIEDALGRYATSPIDVRPVLTACHARSTGHHRLDSPPSDETVAAWIEFTAGTVDRDAIRAALVIPERAR